MLSTCGPWGCKGLDTTEWLNWTEHLYPGLPVLFSPSVVSNCLQLHGLQHSRFPCPSPSPEVWLNSCPLSWWCHPTISSFVIPFSCLQYFPASRSFPMSRLFISGGQIIGASASPSGICMNIQGWFPLGLTGLSSLQSDRGLHRVLFSTTIWKLQFFSA